MTTAAQLAKAISRIVDGAGTKADRARALFDLGCDRGDVVELLGMSYSQAHSIWKKRSSDAGPVRDQSRAGDAVRTTSRRVPSSPLDGVGDALRRGAGLENRGRRTTLFLSPNQVRYATHDGHAVVRVDTNSGPRCRNCEGALVFSIKWLAFIHADSRVDPTELEDRYPD